MKKRTVIPIDKKKAATGREKVGEGAIRKRRIQVEIGTKIKTSGEQRYKRKS